MRVPIRVSVFRTQSRFVVKFLCFLEFTMLVLSGNKQFEMLDIPYLKLFSAELYYKHVGSTNLHETVEIEEHRRMNKSKTGVTISEHRLYSSNFNFKYVRE